MTTLTKSIAAGGSDGYAEADSAFSNTNTYVMQGQNDSGGGSHEVRGFYHWTNITIPPSSIINSTQVTWYNASYGGPAGNVNIRGGFVAADNPSAPTDKAGVWALSLASGYVDRTNPGTGTVTVTGLGTSFGNVIARSGWASGNSVIFLWIDNGSSGDRKWVTGSYEGGYYTYLEVDYTPPGGWVIMFLEKCRRKMYNDLIKQGAIPLGKRELLPI